MKVSKKRLLAYGLLISTAMTFGATANAQANDRAQKVFDFWTAERIAEAQPRDLVLDHRGLAYMKGKGGALVPYGHSKKPELVQMKVKSSVAPMAKPPSNDDTTPPTVLSFTPEDGGTISQTPTFSAHVTDASGVRSVTFNIDYGGTVYNFDASHTGNDIWAVNLQGFTTGGGTWTITATDTAKRGGNTATTAAGSFSVDGNPPPPPPTGDLVTNSRWDKGGEIQNATGRLFYQMASKRGQRLSWAGYVCSATATGDGQSDRTVLITAAHCVYNDESKTFARNVMFIPNQDQTTGSGTDGDCSNDPVGCWVADFGVVEENWTTRTFPNNIPWDYAYYVVGNSGKSSSGYKQCA